MAGSDGVWLECGRSGDVLSGGVALSFEIARDNLQRISQPGFGLRPQPEPRGVWTVESRSTAATAWGKNMPGVPVDGGLDRWFVRFHTLLALPL